MLLLNRGDIKQCVDYPYLVHALELALKGFALTPPVVPARTIITHQPHNAFSLFMPAFMPASQTLGIKVSSFHPTNALQGLPSVNGAVVLIDVGTGQLLAMLDSGALTALRTSAISALATQKLCVAQPLRLAVIGAGSQAAAHIRALAAIRKLASVRIFSRRPGPCAALAGLLAKELSLPIAAAGSIEQALVDADIVCTTTSHQHQQPLVTAAHLKPGVHINAVGGSTVHACEIDPQLLVDAWIYVDHLDGARRESGEIAQALALSLITVADIQDIAALVSGRMPVPAGKRGISYFRSVGHASHDMIIAAAVYATAKARQIGQHCDYLQG